MKRLAFVVALAALAPAARADLNSAAVGTSAAQFLQLGAGARAVAMGEAFTAAADDASALYWNPAGLARLPDRYLSATAMHAPYIASSYDDYVAYAQNFGSVGTLGASFQYFTPGAVRETSVDGTDLGGFNPYDLAVTLGYAHDFGGFLFGASGKSITSRVAGSAHALAADVGVESPAYFSDRLRLALTAQNVGGKLHFDQTDEPLPRVYKAGAAWSFNERWLASADMGLPKNNGPYGAVGAERIWKFSPTFSFAGRAGFNTRTLSGLDGLNSFALGLGFSGRDASLDYAFAPMGQLGATHRFSLSFKFDSRRLKWPERASAPKVVKAPKPKEADTSSVQASVQYSTQTSLPPPSHLHCEEYHGVTVCMDADQRERINISYDPGEQTKDETKPAAAPGSAAPDAPATPTAPPAPAAANAPSAPTPAPAGP